MTIAQAISQAKDFVTRYESMSEDQKECVRICSMAHSHYEQVLSRGQQPGLHSELVVLRMFKYMRQKKWLDACDRCLSDVLEVKNLTMQIMANFAWASLQTGIKFGKLGV